MAASSRKQKIPQRHGQKERYLPIYLGLCDFIYNWRYKPTSHQTFFYKYATNDAPHFPLWPLYQSSILLQKFGYHVMSKKQPKYKEKVTCVKFDRDIFSPCVRGLTYTKVAKSAPNISRVRRLTWELERLYAKGEECYII